MKYSEAYQQTRDIDWFFRIGNRCIHAASNGGKLPDFVNDILRLRQEQAKVAQIEVSGDVKMLDNREYVEKRLHLSSQYGESNENAPNVSNLEIEAYLKSFREMACKGFYSYDRSLDDESIYVLVCSPEKDERPVEGIQLLEVNDEIEFVDDFSSFGIKNNVFDL